MKPGIGTNSSHYEKKKIKNLERQKLIVDQESFLKDLPFDREDLTEVFERSIIHSPRESKQEAVKINQTLNEVKYLSERGKGIIKILASMKSKKVNGITKESFLLGIRKIAVLFYSNEASVRQKTSSELINLIYGSKKPYEKEMIENRFSHDMLINMVLSEREQFKFWCQTKEAQKIFYAIGNLK